MVAKILAQNSSKYFEDQEEDAIVISVGGMFFLRFISPYFFNANTSLPQNTKFTMKQIGRILQAMVAGTELKQADWPEFNVDLVSVHSIKLRHFILSISETDTDEIVFDGT